MMDLQDDFAETLTEEQNQQYTDYQEKLKKANEGHQQFMRELYEKGLKPRALQTEIVQKEIAPTIRAQRFKFEEMLTEMDKKEIQEIKKDDEKQKEAYRELVFRPLYNFSEMNPIPKNPTREELKANRKELKEFKSSEVYKKERAAINNSDEKKKLDNERKSIEKRKEDLAQKYNAEIMGLMDEIKPQREDWHKRIWDNYRIIYKDSPLRKLNDEKFWRDHIDSYHFYKDTYDTKEWHITFLLIDPVGGYKWLDDLESEKLEENSTYENHAFPNPAIVDQTLEFITQQDGNVLVEIINQKGIVVKTILNENRTAGKHQLQVDVSRLLAGNYFYRITDGEGVRSVKFVKK